MIVTGVSLFLSEAIKCYYSQAFWVKMTTLPVADPVCTHGEATRGGRRRRTDLAPRARRRRGGLVGAVVYRRRRRPVDRILVSRLFSLIGLAASSSFRSDPAVARRAGSGRSHEQLAAIGEGDVAPVGPLHRLVLGAVAVDDHLGALGDELGELGLGDSAARERVRAFRLRPSTPRPHRWPAWFRCESTRED